MARLKRRGHADGGRRYRPWRDRRGIHPIVALRQNSFTRHSRVEHHTGELTWPILC
jgi:hypothetical protein